MAPSLTIEIQVQRGSGPGLAVDVQLEVPPGISVLFGRSGAGKSTILGSVAGLLTPRGGRIALGDDVWFDAKVPRAKPVHERHVAVVFQSLALFPHMTALDNVAYGVSRTMPDAQRKQRAMEALEWFRAQHVALRKPKTFSGGEAQRVALARAFAMSPRVVLLDEPFSAMDWELRRDLSEDLKRFAETLRVPMLLVTHHLGEARTLGDRVILLEAGRVTARGTPEDVLPKRPWQDEG